VSRRTTASVAAVPPAIAVRTTPPASTAARADARPRSDRTVCGHDRDWRVSRMAAGIATISPKAKVTPSTRRSNEEPIPSGPSVSSTDDRTGAQTAIRAATEAHEPAAAAARPRSAPMKPAMAMTEAATRGRTRGPRTAADGTRKA
jgi:hypothetical protein